MDPEDSNQSPCDITKILLTTLKEKYNNPKF